MLVFAAWAHLILYGEEATRKARLEGEEAAAAYEQEKKDIAAGKVIAPPPKPPKKKRKKKSETSKEATEAHDGGGTADIPEAKASDTKRAKKKRVPREGRASPKPGTMPETDPLLAKAAISVRILGPRKEFATVTDSEMMRLAMVRIEAARSFRSSAAEANRPLPIPIGLRPCAPMSSVLASTPVGGAMLMGLCPLLFGWNLDTFLSTQCFEFVQEAKAASDALNNEYGVNQYNDSFRTVMQGTVCLIGRASVRVERAWESLGIGPPPLGGSMGSLDCNIGGLAGSCSEAAATIAFCGPSGGSLFQFCANNDEDIVTLNGQRIKASTGSFPLFNEDICTVGARVFVFLLPVR